MASFSERIKVVIDVVSDGANSQLGKFRQAVASADTTTGKLKAGAGAAFDSIKANAGTAALALGTTLVAAGVKAVAKFQDLALEVGKFADATGMSAEEASRWVEVAGDMGISTQQLQAALIKFEKSAATNTKTFKQYGIQIAKTADGNVDITQTTLNAVTAIQKIPDVNQRAKVSQELFGRGYAEIAELIQQDAEDTRAALESVSEEKIIDQGEVDAARELRDALDNLQDIVEDIVLKLGGKLVPAVADAAETFATAYEAVERVAGALDRFLDKLGPVGEGLKKVAGYSVPVVGQFKLIKDVGGAVAGIFGRGSDNAEAYARNARKLADALNVSAAATVEQTAAAIEQAAELAHVEAVTKSVQRATDRETAAIEGAVEAQLDYLDAAQRVTDARRAAVDATFAVRDAEWDFIEAVQTTADVVEDSETSLIEKARAIDANVQSAIALADAEVRLAEETATASGKALTAAERQELWNESMRGSAAASTLPQVRDQIQEVIDRLNNIPREVNTTVRVTTTGAPRAFARGTNSAPGGVALVGEEGPELVELPQGAKVHTAAQTRRMRTASTGGTTNVYVSLPSGTRAEDIARGLQRYRWRNGG